MGYQGLRSDSPGYMDAPRYHFILVAYRMVNKDNMRPECSQVDNLNASQHRRSADIVLDSISRIRFENY